MRGLIDAYHSTLSEKVVVASLIVTIHNLFRPEMAGCLLQPILRIASLCKRIAKFRHKSVCSSVSLVLANPALGINEEPRIQAEIGLNEWNDRIDFFKRSATGLRPQHRGVRRNIDQIELPLPLWWNWVCHGHFYNEWNNPS
jgi:hypothetical protein